MCRRARGIEYTATFEEGSLGLELEEVIVTGCTAGGQAEALGVTAGSRVSKVNHQFVTTFMDLALFLVPAKRPVRLTFLKEMGYFPRARAGELLKLVAGSGRGGGKWPAAAAAAAGDGPPWGVTAWRVYSYTHWRRPPQSAKTEQRR